MTEPEDGRAADAFRAALARHAEEADSDAAVPVHPARRRGRWIATGAALAVAASAVVGFALLDRERPADDALDPIGPSSTVAAGWRGVTFRDVVVQVPDEWGDANAPGSDWCADSPREPIDRPFVDLRASGGFVRLVLCSQQDPVPAGFGPEPQERWVPHLSLVDLAEDDPEPIADGTTTYAGWTLRAQTIGDVQVRLLTDAATEAVADDIMATVQRADLGAAGCDTSSPAQEQPAEGRPVVPTGGTLDAVDSDEVAGLLVCQYDRLGLGSVGLRAERLADAEVARAWLAAVLDAPQTGGPDEPEKCLYPWESDMTLVVHPLDADGTRLATVYVAYDACAGNGVRDAATTWGLTRKTCASLFGERVIFWGGHAASARRCTPER
ncbi:hypothetical protein [uncultured Nocardioides sp.]|uniref:hypothetical protein n=1 Tax=uncultured Nocardioides sp. TaxID=198441 RepID=UPI00262127A1|nr:hypothetical protein [uncultured Nocardioides sp.]